MFIDTVKYMKGKKKVVRNMKDDLDKIKNLSCTLFHLLQKIMQDTKITFLLEKDILSLYILP